MDYKFQFGYEKQTHTTNEASLCAFFLNLTAFRETEEILPKSALA